MVAQAETAPSAQLTIEDAVNLARTHNGTIAAAYYSYLAAHQAALNAFAPLLPSVTGSYTYNDGQQTFSTSGPTITENLTGNIYQALASYRVFDLGNRQDTYLSARRAEESQLDTAHQTLRQVLFNVQDQYYETLRASELEKVAKTQVERAQAIYNQTHDQVDVGKTARKDLSQANADLANAKVSELTARNTTATTTATLKSLIGFPASQPLPALPTYPVPDTSNVPTDLNKVLDDGVFGRPDLNSQRQSVKSLEYTARLAALQAGISLALDASFGASWAPAYQEDRLLTLTLSYPIFDGGASRAAAREASYNVKAAKQTLIQAERDARAQIETAFVQLRQNVERLSAAKEAYAAALENFNSASESQRLGASTIIDVLTANVSLVTAESNQIQAVYDYYISQVQFDLVTGYRLLGEPTGDRLPQYK